MTRRTKFYTDHGTAGINQNSDLNTKDIAKILRKEFIVK